MKFVKKKIKDLFTRYNGTNINNVTVNYLLSPIFSLFLYRLLTSHYMIPSIDPSAPLGGALYLTLCSTLFFCYSSTFFQPDLDQDTHRPGKFGFPLGTTISNTGIGRFIRWATWPINRIWYYLWEPFGGLLTHRGAGHWPVIGVWLRILYLYAWYIFIEGLAVRFGFYSPNMRIFEFWCQAFFPGTQGFGTVGFYVFCLPVFMGDIFHSAVDLYESYKKGNSFCPQTMKKGLIYRILIEFKDIPLNVIKHFREFLD
jgi:uncharacterized metal-binding protein